MRLTPAGRDTFARLDASHARSIERHFSSFITEDEALVIVRVLNRVTAAARQSLAGATEDPTGTTGDGISGDAAG